MNVLGGTAPWGIVFEQDILVVVHDDVLVVAGYNDMDRTLLGLGKRLRLDARLDLAIKYEELASLYFSSPSYSKLVTVAKVDATANDVPEEIQGFPSIKLFPAGVKDSPIDYSGSRTTEDLANFIKENGKHHVDAYENKTGVVDEEMPDAESMGKQAPAATEKEEGAAASVKSMVSEATEAVKTATQDSDGEAGGRHDEL
jgi:protein disulfide-isomerase A1